MAKIALKPNLQIGIVPTHIKFVGGLVPDENGKMPRGQDGKMLISTELEHIYQTSRVAPNCAQNLCLSWDRRGGHGRTD